MINLKRFLCVIKSISLSEEVRDLTKVERVGAHSHIRGLGVDKNFQPKPVKEFFFKLFFLLEMKLTRRFFIRSVMEWLAKLSPEKAQLFLSL